MALLQVQQKLTGADESSAYGAQGRVQRLIQEASSTQRQMLMPLDWEPWL